MPKSAEENEQILEAYTKAAESDAYFWIGVQVIF